MKKKVIKMILGGLLAGILVFAVAACGIAKKDNSGGTASEAPAAETPEIEEISVEQNTSAETPEEAKKGSLEGAWQGEIDMTDMISASAGMEINTKLIMVLNMVINGDNTYSINLDMDRFIEDTIAYYNDEMPSLIRQAIIDEGIPEDMLESTLAEQGYESFDEFVKELLDGMIKELEEGMNTENTTLSKGTYEVKDTIIEFDEEEGDGTMEDEGTINSDGTITVVVNVDEAITEVRFSKK